MPDEVQGRAVPVGLRDAVNRDALLVKSARRVHGAIRVPGDKSLSHRYLMFGAMARGMTVVSGLAPGADVASTAACLRAMGVPIDSTGPNAVRVHGRGWEGLSRPAGSLDANNSGTTLRLLSGILAGRPFETTITGDESLRRRPMRRVIDPLAAMGAAIGSNDGRAPLTITGGGLHSISWRSPVASAQVKSAIMLAGLTADGTTSVTEPLPTRDHTERAFPAFGLSVRIDGTSVFVTGGQEATAPAGPLSVPGDPSSAAVWAAAAAALPGSSIRIEGVCLNPRRLGFIRALERMGARVSVEQTGEVGGEPVGVLEVSHDAHVTGVSLEAADVPDLIDELPVLAARAALGGSLEVSGAGELRVKESDRISALVAGFAALGVRAEERPDGFVIDGSARPSGGRVDAAGDHRLVMAFALVGLGASGPTEITGADAVAVSYPGFDRDLARLAE
jgi:3-phosphoshikimate 1-carboxyvinyltransferase